MLFNICSSFQDASRHNVLQRLSNLSFDFLIYFSSYFIALYREKKNQDQDLIHLFVYIYLFIHSYISTEHKTRDTKNKYEKRDAKSKGQTHKRFINKYCRYVCVVYEYLYNIQSLN